MMRLEIKQSNDPVLRLSTEKVNDFGMETQSLIDNMIETMRQANGVGLAAPQVDVSKKIIVCEFQQTEKESAFKSFPLTALCNPTIIKKSKKTKNMVEGCLSFPGLEVIVKRPKEITVLGKDRYGNDIKIEADNFFARVLQHEIDHLNSTLLIDHIEQMDIIFIGTGSLGLPALKMLAIDPQYNIRLVITGDNKAISRDHHQKENPIEKLANHYGLPLLKTKNINDKKILERLMKIKPTLGIMADFGQIVSQEIINIPKHGIINIHPSLLPKHRGPSPIQQTILDGDKETGVSLLLTGEKMDAGDIITQVTIPLRGTETAEILKKYLAEIGASLLMNSIPYYLTGDLKPAKQDDSKATYNKLFTKEDGYVDEKTDCVTVDRKIRAFNDWPKTYTVSNGKRVQLLAGHFEKDGSFLLDRVKPEGRKEMTYEDFRHGYRSELTFKG